MVAVDGVAEEVRAVAADSADSEVVVSAVAGQAEVGKGKIYDEIFMMYDLLNQTYRLK